MSSGEIRPSRENIIENPENYEEMVKKLREKEERDIKKVLDKRKVETERELKELAEKAIVTRARAARDQKILKDMTIQKESSNPDIKELKRKLNEEIKSIATQALNELPSNIKQSLEDKGQLKALKGRVHSQLPEA